MGQTSFTISLQRLGKDILQSGHVIPVQGQIAHFTGIANLDFHGAPLQSLGANHDADGITDEVGILEFDTSPFITVIKDGIDSLALRA